MGNQAATLERTRSKQHDGGPQLPPNLLQPKRVQVARASYSSPQGKSFAGSDNFHRVAQKVDFLVRKTRSRSPRRPANYRLFAVLAPTMVVSLLLVKSLFLPSFRASVPQQSESLPQKTVALPSPLQVNPPVSPAVIALRRAIIGKESEANFLALNPHSKALGLAQIMPDSLSDWSQELLGRRIAPDEFLQHPELQLMIIDHKLSEYWHKALANSNGDEELAVLKVASSWYSGKPNRYKSTRAQWYKGTDGRSHRYPSVAEYSHSILRKYRQYREEAG